MEFSRDDKNTIRCIITEAEIEELGYTIDDIISNGARTQEFMNHIFDMAEQEFETKFEMGIKTVRADLLSDHTLALTFSEHPATENMMEHIKDIVSGLLNSIPQKKLDEINDTKLSGLHKSLEHVKGVGDKGEESLRIIVLFVFEKMDILMKFAKQIRNEVLPFNQLYKYNEVYFLMMDLSDSTEERVKALSVIVDEYADDLFVGAEKRAFIYEHGTAILKERAIEQLRQI